MRAIRFFPFAAPLWVAAICFQPALSTADPITLLETGPALPNCQGTGSSLFDRQFVGFRFLVATPSITQEVGAHLLFGNPVFAALVQLDGPLDVPNSADLSTSDVLAVGRIVPTPVTGPGGQSAEFHTPISASLQPGWHALVLGAGLFGTEGDFGTALPFGAGPGQLSAFISQGLDPGARFKPWEVLPGFLPRVVVEGQTITSPIPEPGSMTLLTLGLVGLGVRRWRQRKA
jgi:hypothetical protein